MNAGKKTMWKAEEAEVQSETNQLSSRSDLAIIAYKSCYLDKNSEQRM